MRLHGIRALGSLAFLSTITSAAPADNGIEAISGLVARDTWNDDYGSVPVGSFSFIIDPYGTLSGEGACTVTIKTQEYPDTGRVYSLNAPTSGSATTDCDSNLPHVLSILLTVGYNAPFTGGDYNVCSYAGSDGFPQDGNYAYYANTNVNLGLQEDTRCSWVNPDRYRCIILVNPPAAS